MTRVERAKQYAALVEKYAHDGEISAVGRPILQRQQMQLQLTEADAQAIEQHVLQRLDRSATATPSQASSDSKTLNPQPSTDSASSVSSDRADSAPTAQAAETTEPQDEPEKLQQYEQGFRQAIQLESPPGDLLRQGLQQSQHSLNLSNAAIEAIEAKVTHQFQTEQAQYHAALEKYSQEVAEEAALGLPLSRDAQDHLAEIQRSLKLRPEDAQAIEERVVARLLMPPPTELSDSPPTQLTARSETLSPDALSPDALTEMPPPEAISFISAAEMPPDDSSPFVPFESASAFQQLNPEESLRSEKGVDYSPLRDLLRAAKWQEADEATLKAMLLATNRAEQGWLDADSLLRFPCLDLHTIDRLWSYHSNGKFGFTAQWRAYPIPKLSKATTSFQPSRIAQEHTLRFVKDMGWWVERVEFLKYYNRLTFNLNEAPQGHLPALWYWAIPWWKAIQTGGIGATRGGCSVNDQSISIFMSRLKTCGFE